MALKDDPNNVTTKEIMDALECGRTNVQKLEIAEKLHRVGVEGNRVYYPRHEMEALQDEKAYRPTRDIGRIQAPAPRHSGELLPMDVAYRKMERAFFDRYEASRQPPPPPPQPDPVPRAQQENDLQEQERPSEKVDWKGLIFCFGALGLLGWSGQKALHRHHEVMRQQKEAEQADLNREIELKFMLLGQKGRGAAFDEYLALRWRMAHPNDPAWDALPSFMRHPFQLEVTVPLGLATEAEVEEYKRARGPLPWKLPVGGGERSAESADSTSTDGGNHDGAV